MPVQADKVKATYRDGVLEVRLPKAEEIKPKGIKIYTAQSSRAPPPAPRARAEGPPRGAGTPKKGEAHTWRR